MTAIDRITNPSRNDNKVGEPKNLVLKQKNKCTVICNRFQHSNSDTLQKSMSLDEINVVSTFTWLHFEVELKPNLSATQMKKYFNNLRHQDFSDIECFACYIGSHGDNGCVYGNDGKKVQIATIIKELIDCPPLRGKCKLLFVDACRGEKHMDLIPEGEDMVDYAKPVRWKAKDAEMFVLFSTTIGHVSWADNEFGSYFTSILCKVLRAYGGKRSLNDIVTKVTELTSKRIVNEAVLVSEVQSTLTCNIFFKPTDTFDAAFDAAKLKVANGGSNDTINQKSKSHRCQVQ